MQAPVATKTVADATKRHADVLGEARRAHIIAFSAGSERMQKAAAAAWPQAASIWRACKHEAAAFGLVSVPVYMHAAVSQLSDVFVYLKP